MTITRAPLKDRARGRWRAILSLLGLADAKTLSGRHVPCPFCGGRDRFRFDDRDGAGTFICSQCGAGDGVTFVMRRLGVDFRAAAEKIETIIGAAAVAPSLPQHDERSRRMAMNALWGASRPVTAGDPVNLFHQARGIRLAACPPCLRYCARARYQTDASVTHHPAQIALVHGPDGRPASLHRTFLTMDGAKADVDAPRRLMAGVLPRGSAVRLADAGDVLGIAEGVETALAASILFEVPVWAVLNAGNMGAWSPPDGVHTVIVFADHDENFTGQAAAYGLAKRLATMGVSASVRVPDRPGDFNNVLFEAAHVAA